MKKSRGLLSVILAIAMLITAVPMMVVSVHAAETYTVTFDTQGGSYIEPQEVAEGGRAVRPENPMKGDTLFHSWRTSPGDEGRYFDFSERITRDMTLYATYLIKAEAFAYPSNGGKVSSSRYYNEGPWVETIQIESQNNINIFYATPNDGWEFVEWRYGTADGDVVTSTNKEDDYYINELDPTCIIFKCNENHVFYAIFQRVEDEPSYTITFNLNGGTYNGASEIMPQEVRMGYKGNYFQPRKEGWAFYGWCENPKDRNSRYLSDEDGFFEESFDRDIVLYAKWVKWIDLVPYNWGNGENEKLGEVRLGDAEFSGSRVTYPIFDDYNEPVVIEAKPAKGVEFKYWLTDMSVSFSEERITVLEDDYLYNNAIYYAAFHAHSLQYNEGWPATCDDWGLKVYWECIDCGKRFTNEEATEEISDYEIEPLGHDWGEWVETKQPTRTEPGEKHRVCKRDPSHTETEEIPATGGDTRVTPTPVNPRSTTPTIPTKADTPFTIIYDLNGGMIDGKTDDVKQVFKAGEDIVIMDAPTREGYTFQYWGIATYNPGDKYIVNSQKFVAVWAKEEPVGRLSGQTRYDTAFAVADELYKVNGPFENIIVAYGDNFPDALSGGYLAKVMNAPILLVNSSTEDRVTSYISKFIAKDSNSKPKGTVYILGGTGVVSSAFEQGLNANGINVFRLAGDDRYGTNLAILKETVTKGQEIIVATGKTYPDSLSGSAIGKGMLLVGDNLSEEQKAWIADSGISKFYILGGQGAISATIEEELKSFGTVERVAGQDRWGTSSAIANKFFSKAATVALASGLNFPDGLSGAPIAMKNNAPIILVADGAYGHAKDFVARNNVGKVIIVGGTFAVSDSVVSAVVS